MAGGYVTGGQDTTRYRNEKISLGQPPTPGRHSCSDLQERTDGRARSLFSTQATAVRPRHYWVEGRNRYVWQISEGGRAGYPPRDLPDARSHERGSRNLRGATGTIPADVGKKKEEERVKEERNTARLTSRAAKNEAAGVRGSQGMTRRRGIGRGHGVEQGGGRGHEANEGPVCCRGRSAPGLTV